MRVRAPRDLLPGRRREGADPYGNLNLENVRLMGALMWLAGLVIAAILLPFAPPTVAVGWAGWVLAAAAFAVCLAVIWRRLDRRFNPSVGEMLAAGYLAVALIALLEWLAGGQASPYHYLYALPAAFAGAIHSPRRLVPFAAVLALGVCAPLLYGHFSAERALDSAGLLMLLVALGLAARTLVGRLRGQRASLQAERDDATRLSRRDALTGLGNRLAFEEALGAAVARANRSGRPLSLMMADLDCFKEINDRLGHLVGDRCLRSVAAALKAGARAGDECFRWGGDEFAIVLADTPAPEARRAAVRFSSAVASIPLADDHCALSLSCAVAELREGEGVLELVTAADRELLGYKSGRMPSRGS